MTKKNSNKDAPWHFAASIPDAAIENKKWAIERAQISHQFTKHEATQMLAYADKVYAFITSSSPKSRKASRKSQ